MVRYDFLLAGKLEELKLTIEVKDARSMVLLSTVHVYLSALVGPGNWTEHLIGGRKSRVVIPFGDPTEKQAVLAQLPSTDLNADSHKFGHIILSSLFTPHDPGYIKTLKPQATLHETNDDQKGRLTLALPHRTMSRRKDLDAVVRLNRLRASREKKRAGWAQFRLAMRYRDGDGVRPDSTKAAALLRQATQSPERGVATAAHEALSQMLPGGYQQEMRRAFTLFIEQDYANALVAFTRCLEIRPHSFDAPRLLCALQKAGPQCLNIDLRVLLFTHSLVPQTTVRLATACLAR